MKIYYQMSTNNWYHGEMDVKLTFGANNIEIPYQQSQLANDVISFDVDQINTQEILTIGILTTANSKNQHGLGGNLPLFQSLHEYLLKYGIFSYVFTTEDALNQTNCGYIYSIKSKKWRKISVPLPHIVYNRIPLRSFEASPSFQQLKTIFSKQDMIMFNPCFIDKYEMYSTFKQHEELKRLLPETILIRHFKSFASFFHTHKHIYVKPRDGNRGKGIYTLTQEKDKCIQLTSPSYSESFSSLSEYWNKYKKQLQTQKYLAQEAIIPKKKNGHRYDYRLLAHYEKGSFKLSGKAVRMSQTQEITTHVPQGGKLYPYHEVSTQSLDQQLTKITQTSGTVLSKHLGFIGEFSMDLGENEEGALFIYEVNSKPMQFDETDIEENRLLQLKKLFIELKDTRGP